MKKALIKDTIKEIKNTKKRFISILLIILLGSAIYAGINSVCPDMKNAANDYYNLQNLMDFKLVSTYGITNEDITEINKMDEVKSIMPSYSFDSLTQVGENEIITKVNTIPFGYKEDYINKIKIINGRLPENLNECIVEDTFLAISGLKIGDKIVINPEETFKDKLNTKEFEIVGSGISPYYMSLDKGSSSLGSGKINSFIYILDSAINSDVFTEVFVTINRDMQDNTYEKNYVKYANKVQVKLEELANIRKDIRYNEIVNEASNKINEAEIKLNEKVKEANDEILYNESKLQEGQTQISNSEREIKNNENKSNIEFKNAQNKLNQAEILLISKEKEFSDIKEESIKQFELAQKTISDLNNIKKLETLQKDKNLEQINILSEEMKFKSTILEELKLELNSANEIDKPIILEKINKVNSEIESIKKNIESLTKENNVIETKINEYIKNINIITKELNSKKESLIKAENDLSKAKTDLTKQKSNFISQKKNTQNKIYNAKLILENSKNDIANSKLKIEDAKNKLSEEVKKAEIEIKNAEDDLSSLKRPKWYVLGRDKLECYVRYEQDADRIASLALVFPVVFFLVAALVSLTSMTRMVEEQRLQIGTLKALGYSKSSIASKYLWYSTLAALIGSIVGVIIGFNVIPSIVFNVYGILYTMPMFIPEFNILYAAISIGISILCTTIATLMACINELKNTPASLMRPKSPKMGKRVFLEKINFLWSKLSFIHKVTARNIFRYKKRLFMTVIGIAGCSALLLAAFGLKDSVLSIASTQYGDIFKYNLQLSVNDNKVEEFLNSKKDINEFTFTRNEAVKLNKDNLNKEAQIIVIPDNVEINKYINLKSRTINEVYKLDNESVILTEQIAKALNVKQGDTIKLKFNEEDVAREVKILGISENYVYHYVYMSEELYEKTFAKELKYNNVYANLNNDLENSNEFLQNLLQNGNISSANLTEGIAKIYEDSMGSLNYVVLVLIVAAGLLALIVLYNLSNVNISERVRELATIKVLGFYDREVSSYVDRESIILTLIGIALGLIFGQFLNYFIITTCETDMAMLVRVINPMSYIISIVITIVFSIFVNILTHFSLKKIDMIESLKSVE